MYIKNSKGRIVAVPNSLGLEMIKNKQATKINLSDLTEEELVILGIFKSVNNLDTFKEEKVRDERNYNSGYRQRNIRRRQNSK